MTIFLWLLGGLVSMFLVVVFRGAPYVPSRRPDVIKAFDELYQLGKDDLLVDIGSGDGVILRLASKRGARAIGFEINPVLVVLSKIISLRDSKVKVRWADFWLVKLPQETTIVYTFGESRHIVKMAEYIRREASRLNKTLYFMSYGFEIPKTQAIKKSTTHFLYRFGPLQ